MKITEEVYQVGGGGLTDPDDGAVYLIRFGEDAALVDAGCGRSVEKLLRNVCKCGAEPEKLGYLLITHCHFDHTGGIQPIREKTGCRVVAHEEDARYLEEGDSTVTAAKWYGSFFPPTDIDLKLKGERNDLELGGRKIHAIHTPGHSPGSVVYLPNRKGSRCSSVRMSTGPSTRASFRTGKTTAGPSGCSSPWMPTSCVRGTTGCSGERRRWRTSSNPFSEIGESRVPTWICYCACSIAGYLFAW